MLRKVPKPWEGAGAEAEEPAIDDEGDSGGDFHFSSANVRDVHVHHDTCYHWVALAISALLTLCEIRELKSFSKCSK